MFLGDWRQCGLSGEANDNCHLQSVEQEKRRCAEGLKPPFCRQSVARLNQVAEESKSRSLVGLKASSG
jgi:hypothetical protein